MKNGENIGSGLSKKHSAYLTKEGKKGELGKKMQGQTKKANRPALY